MSEIKSLPPAPFDGQIFIDAFRVRWQFDGSSKCWMKIGKESDIPVASENQTGLLTSRLKQLLDSIPTSGGHFGIVAQPLLSLVPQNPSVIIKNKVLKSVSIDSGTKIIVDPERNFTPTQFAGKVLIFKTGLLTKKAFLIFNNDESSITVEGDASESSKNDEFEVVDSADLNPNGILLGDIMLVSDSIDISCVDGDGLPLTDSCNLDTIYCDNVNNPPGLDFKINSNFLDSLCITIPGCKGPKGNRGLQGLKGEDGTGDGPQGETGDPGVDAPDIGNTFSGIKIIDIDDIYDTAIVSLELDAANGKLNIVRAKVRTPDSSTPATQLISTPISRSVQFTDSSSFDYKLLKPNGDPLDEIDVDILKYPHQYGINSSGGVLTTSVDKVKLSDLINSMISYYDDKLVEISDQYNLELKSYIESKDEAARIILANLANELASCEFELPIDFCLGISPSDCRQTSSSSQPSFNFGLASSLFAFATDSDEDNVTASSLGRYKVPATAVPPPPDPEEEDPLVEEAFSSDIGDPYISVKYPNNEVLSNTSTLPSGFYVVKINPEGSAIRSSDTEGWIINSDNSGEGLEVIVQSGDESAIIYSGSPPSIDFNPLEKSSVEKAYAEADYVEQVIAVELTQDGKITLSAFLPGTGAQGSVNVEVLKINVPDGATLIV